MFLDASAFCAMLMREEDAEFFASKLRDATRRITSPMAIWETVVNLSKGLDIELETARLEVERHLFEFKIEILPWRPKPLPSPSMLFAAMVKAATLQV